MGNGDRYWQVQSQKEALNKAESEGRVADSKQVRLALMDKFHRGEATLEEIQAELKLIKKNAKSNGLVTRDQAYNGY